MNYKCKGLQEIRIKLLVQLWKYCYQRTTPETGQSTGPR